MSLQATVFETGAGWCGFAWSAGGLTAFGLPMPSEAVLIEEMARAALRPEDGIPAPWRGLVTDVRRYFEGKERVEFYSYPVDLTGTGPFARRVYAVMRGIPWGEVRTYGEVAAGAGNPRAARAAGQACADNPVPLIIPCHRVVAAGGIGGFGGRLELKRLLLGIEGVKSYGERKC
ncbi:MAG: methylated-DNA--[protein]-cysteine S-methyltransferase [Firmicutes bacterium]|nr:methylated-DNA--[protein]-cysteine S-methyltransferase [Bacillota bacterium]